MESLDIYRDLFCFPIIDYYKKIGIDMSKEDYEALAVEWVELYMEATKNAGLVTGVRETLEYISEKGISQAVLSATEIQMLRGQLTSLGIVDCFDEIMGLDNINAYSKRSIGVAWRELHKDAKVLFVGDTHHDYDVACAMGADCVLMTTGHQSRAKLEETGAKIIDSPLELRDIIE